jgi:hypothetical protein
MPRVCSPSFCTLTIASAQVEPMSVPQLQRVVQPQCTEPLASTVLHLPECRKASKVESQRRWLSKPENQNHFRGSANVERVRLIPATGVPKGVSQ